jgi:hypothetical protein
MLVVRPSRHSYDRVARSEGSLADRVKRSLPLLLPGLAVVTLVLVYRLREAPSVAGLVFGIALVLLIVGGGLGIRELTFSRARLEVGGDGIAYTGALGMKRHFGRVDIQRIHLCSIETYTHRYHPLAIVVGKSDRVLFRLWGEFWDARELRQVFDALGVKPEGSWASRTTAWRLRREAKWALPIWWWPVLWNPLLGGLGCSCLSILVIATTLALWSALHPM